MITNKNYVTQKKLKHNKSVLKHELLMQFNLK